MPPRTQPSSLAETLRKFSVPISIVIAGALIAGSLFLVNSRAPSGPAEPSQGAVEKEIRGVQADDHILGNQNADVVIVEFADTECPFCKIFHSTLHQIMTEYGSSGKVAWVYRHFPFEQIHPKALKEAEALECATEQGGNETFWKYADKLYKTTNSNNSLDIGVYNTPKEAPLGADGKPSYTEKAPRSASDAGQLSDVAQQLDLDVPKFEACLASGKYAAHVQKDLAEAIAAGGQGTPYSIVISGGEQIPLEGAQPYDTVKTVIDTLIK